MIAKLVEIRDIQTLIPAVAIKCEAANDAEQFLLDRAGYHGGGVYVFLGNIEGDSCGDFTYDPFGHKSARTLKVAHLWIQNNFDSIKPGDVVDVQFLLGETTVPKVSERT